MSSQTPNINLTLPTGAENVSRQIINDNNTKIDTAIGTLNDNIRYQEITITLTPSSGRTISQSAGWSGYKLISATFVQNDDLYYTCVTDGIYPSISITQNDEIQLLGMNKLMQTSANRNLKILCVYKAV